MAVRCCGGTKIVACQLWPEKTPDSAGRTLVDCLNEHREARLSPDQLMLVARLPRDHVVSVPGDRLCRATAGRAGG